MAIGKRGGNEASSGAKEKEEWDEERLSVGKVQAKLETEMISK